MGRKCNMKIRGQEEEEEKENHGDGSQKSGEEQKWLEWGGLLLLTFEFGNDIFCEGRRVMGHYGYYAFYENKVCAYL